MPGQDGTGPKGDGPMGRGRRNRGRMRGQSAPFRGMFAGGPYPGADDQNYLGQCDRLLDESIRREAPANIGTVAVSSRGPELDSQLEPRFGRAAGFIIIDPKTMEYRYLDNALGCALATGAGIYAAEALVRSGVRVIITGSPGPKALRALSAAGIRIVQSPGGKTVREAVDSFRDTEMSALDETQNRA